jgi:hypothetical protein
MEAAAFHDLPYDIIGHELMARLWEEEKSAVFFLGFVNHALAAQCSCFLSVPLSKLELCGALVEGSNWAMIKRFFGLTPEKLATLPLHRCFFLRAAVKSGRAANIGYFNYKITDSEILPLVLQVGQYALFEEIVELDRRGDFASTIPMHSDDPVFFEILLKKGRMKESDRLYTLASDNSRPRLLKWLMANNTSPSDIVSLLSDSAFHHRYLLMSSAIARLLELGPKDELMILLTIIDDIEALRFLVSSLNHCGLTLKPANLRGLCLLGRLEILKVILQSNWLPRDFPLAPLIIWSLSHFDSSDLYIDCLHAMALDPRATLPLPGDWLKYTKRVTTDEEEVFALVKKAQDRSELACMIYKRSS